MQVTYLKQKTYTDGSNTLMLKNGNMPLDPVQAQFKRAQTRHINSLKRLELQTKLIEEYNKLNSLCVSNGTARRLHQIECLLNLRNLQDMKRSANRARQELQDICACNDFLFFVTLTFDKEKLNRLNDKETRAAYSAWAKEMHRRFPTMYFATAPEYHKKGGLHFHILVGGVAFEDLKPEFWKNQTKGKNKGKPIYNVTAWENGYSTVMHIYEQNATKNYICKYINKQNFDERFFGKKRYYVSRNIQRPTIIKETVPKSYCNLWDIDFDKWDINYFDFKKQYGIFKQVQPIKITEDNKTIRKSCHVELQTPQNIEYSQSREYVWELASKCGILEMGHAQKVLTSIESAAKARNIKAYYKNENCKFQNDSLKREKQSRKLKRDLWYAYFNSKEGGILKITLQNIAELQSVGL